MKFARSFSLDSETVFRLEAYAKENNLYMSDVVDRAIKQFFARLETKEVLNITCPTCGSVYSSVLTACPGCRPKRATSDIDEVLEAALDQNNSIIPPEGNHV